MKKNKKVLFLSLNAKYIHTSPAVRLLYKKTMDEYESRFLEKTIKDNFSILIGELGEYDAIGLSCYIWNIERMMELSALIKKTYPEKIVFAGGPEVTYEPETFVSHFDYVLCGEGEEMITPFLDYVFGYSIILPDGVASPKNPHAISQYVKDMNSIPDILDTYTEDDKLNRIIYVETNRGCPFNCAYCLSSVEKGVRFFNSDRLDRTIEFIRENKFKCVKFLDRTFNVNPKRFVSLLKSLENTENTYQFEIAIDLFDEEVMHFLTEEVEKSKFRLEIGVQSLNDKAISSVGRYQDSRKLLEYIKRLNDSDRVTVHTDLIAGLPNEDFQSFRNSFDRTFSLRSEELQLGFLKLLRGTMLRIDANKYGYEYMATSPYEVIRNDFISREELDVIRRCEESLEWMWNDKRCVRLINHLMDDDAVDSFFDFFVGFSAFYMKEEPLHYNYGKVVEYLKYLGIMKDEYLFDLKYDFLYTSRVKPMPFWKNREDDDYHKKEFDYMVLGLGEEYRNSFITDYYDKYIIIKYEKGRKPSFEMLDLGKTIGRIPKKSK